MLSNLPKLPAQPDGAGLLITHRDARATVAPAWSARLLDTVSAYLPLLLMALLALGTWWLVKNTPMFDSAPRNAPPRHEPDYTMARFKVQRFAPDGPLRMQIEGELMRHYPDTNTIEIDNPRIRALAPDGHVIVATARHAVANGDGSEVQLSGGAHLVRESAVRAANTRASIRATARAGPPTSEAAIEFRSEFLHYSVHTEQIRSHLPVTLTQGPSELRANAFSFDNLNRSVDLKGRVHAVFAMPAVTADRPGRQ